MAELSKHVLEAVIFCIANQKAARSTETTYSFCLGLEHLG